MKLYEASSSNVEEGKHENTDGVSHGIIFIGRTHRLYTGNKNECQGCCT